MTSTSSPFERARQMKAYRVELSDLPACFYRRYPEGHRPTSSHINLTGLLFANPSDWHDPTSPFATSLGRLPRLSHHHPRPDLANRAYYIAADDATVAVNRDGTRWTFFEGNVFKEMREAADARDAIATSSLSNSIVQNG